MEVFMILQRLILFPFIIFCFSISILCVLSGCEDREGILDVIGVDTTATAYSGKTNQDKLIWFIRKKDVIKYISFTYQTDYEGFGWGGWGEGGNTVMEKGRFEYIHIGQPEDTTSIRGNQIRNEEFVGVWQTTDPQNSGTWEASKSDSLCVRTLISYSDISKNLTLSVGDSIMLFIECGISPYYIVETPDPSIAIISPMSVFDNNQVRSSLVQITGVSAGETAIKFRDSSFPEQLEGQLNIKIK